MNVNKKALAILSAGHLGMASGLMVGFAIGTGGIGVTLLGMVADTWGVPMALKTIIALPLPALGLSLLVKYPPFHTSKPH